MDEETTPGVLFVVGTPIGNLDDLTSRALKVLQEVDLIACEDTRHTGKLLRHFQICTPTLSYHEHNETERTRSLLRELVQGKSVALLSDAGTPLLSDPGFELVRACREHGLTVLPVPGPSALTAALSVSGLPTDRFLFVGFPKKRRSARRTEFEELKEIEASLVFFIAPHALRDHLRDLRDVLGDREAFLAREITKVHEQHWRGTLGDIIAAQLDSPRGEYTLVLEGASQSGPRTLDLDVKAYVTGLEKVRSLTRNQAIKQAAQELQLNRNELYRQLAVRDRKESS